METATIVVTRTVTKAMVAGRVMNLRPDTTDVNASSRIAPYVRSSNWTYGYAGPKDNSMLIVVGVRYLRGESVKSAWDRATKSLEKLIAKNGGSVV